jgi:hypothetical protein
MSGATATSLSSSIRERLKMYMIVCPCCGQARKSYRAAAAELGVGHAMLFRFMAGGSRIERPT